MNRPRAVSCAVLAIAIAGVAALLSCGRRETPPQAGADVWRLRVCVTIPPLAFLVERVGGAHVLVETLVAPGVSPHSFEPTPKQVAALNGAALYFTIGLPIERPLAAKLGRSGLRVVELTASSAPALPRGADDAQERDAHEIAETAAKRSDQSGAKQAAHEDHDGHKHGHDADLDPHVWLDPLRMKEMAVRVRDALQRADLSNAESYRANCAALLVELDQLHERVAAQLAPFGGRAFYVFHPAYGHFARRYGLRQVAIEVEGKEPTPRQMGLVIAQARAERAKVIFSEPQFPARTARIVATEIGARVETLDPLAHDYIDNLRRVAERIAAALASQPP